jgi:hypothetical protein
MFENAVISYGNQAEEILERYLDGFENDVISYGKVSLVALL